MNICRPSDTYASSRVIDYMSEVWVNSQICIFLLLCVSVCEWDRFLQWFIAFMASKERRKNQSEIKRKKKLNNITRNADGQYFPVVKIESIWRATVSMFLLSLMFHLTEPTQNWTVWIAHPQQGELVQQKAKLLLVHSFHQRKMSLKVLNACIFQTLNMSYLEWAFINCHKQKTGG